MTTPTRTFEGTPANAAPRRGLPPTVAWVGDLDGELRLLDQTLLPRRVETRACRTPADVFEAIRALRVRGAPAIGVAAAFGLVLALRDHGRLASEPFARRIDESARFLASSRPTAVNLAWALDRTARAAVEALEAGGAEAALAAALAEARAIAAEDEHCCRRIGEAGAHLVNDGAGILTHCNAGALATVGIGTALAPLYVAYERGVRFRVWVDETRPLLQGSRLTAFELASSGIDVTVLCDGAAAGLLASGKVQLVVVGADRIARNGDTANKVGTLSLALAARHYGIPFYVASPLSTFDPRVAAGAEIPIEERPGEEVREPSQIEGKMGRIGVWNPAFDVTPGGLIRAIITERGLLQPVTEESLASFFSVGGLAKAIRGRTL